VRDQSQSAALMVLVRIDAEGGVYAGLIAKVDKIDSKGRIELLLGMIRHTLPADMVVAT
jgi:hypothetical protein